MDKLVKPLETKKMVMGTVPRIDVSQNMGLGTAVASGLNQLTEKYKALKNEQMAILGENYYSSLVGKALDYETKMQYDKSYYEKDENLQKLYQEKEEYTNNFIELCKKNNVNMDIANAYIEAGKNRFDETQERYFAKHNVWLEERNREYYLMGLDEKANNISRKMISGSYNEGVSDFYNLSNEYFMAAERGDIPPSVVIDNILKQRTNMIYADVEQWVNKPEGIQELEQMAGKTFKEFDEKYRALNLKIYGKEIMLSEDDFQAFKRAVAGAMNTINARKSAAENKNLYEQKKAETWIRENPVDATMKNYAAGTVINEKFSEFALQVVNNKYGTSYKDLEQIYDENIPINLIGSANSKAEIYNNVDIGGENQISEILIEANELCGGQEKKFQNNVLDARYNDGSTNIVPGARGTRLLMQPDSNYYKTYAAIYSEPNKKILAGLKNIEIPTDTLHAMYKEDMSGVSSTTHNINTMLPGQMIGNYAKGDRGIYEKKGEYTEADIGGILRAMELAGQVGDYHSARTAKDIRQLESDYVKLAVFNATGGFLDKEVAKEIGEENMADMMLSELKPNTLQKVFNYYMQEPGRLKRVFGSENEMRRKANNELKGAITEMLGDTQAIDVGYGRFVSIRPELNGGDIAKAVAAKLNKEEYITENGTLVGGRSVQLVGKPEDNILIVMYDKRPVYKETGKDKEGKPIFKQVIFDLNEVK